MLSKSNLFLVLLSGINIACTNQQKQEDNSAEKTSIITKKGSIEPIMDFMGKNKVDLGHIKEGEKISHIFEFVNSGKSPLQISYANASCGCTVPSWPKEPIAPGEKGAITVEFNSKNKEGKLSKNVSIYANTKPEINNISFTIEVED